MSDPAIFDNVASLVAAAADRPPKHAPYKVSVLQGEEQLDFYLFAPSNQAAIAAVARDLLLAHCKPLPTEDLLQAMVDTKPETGSK